jgi:hypothetical protein
VDDPQQQDGDATGGTRRGRASQRDSLFVMATMRRAGEQPSTIRVRNLSRTGLMAEATASFVPGDPVEVELRGIGAVAARVMWREAARLGVSFDTPIDPRMARKPVVVRPAAPAPATPPTMRRPRLFG